MATETTVTSTRTDFSIELLLIGDCYVGRTCILERFSEDVFKPDIPFSGRAKDIIQSIDYHNSCTCTCNVGSKLLIFA